MKKLCEGWNKNICVCIHCLISHVMSVSISFSFNKKAQKDELFVISTTYYFHRHRIETEVHFFDRYCEYSNLSIIHRAILELSFSKCGRVHDRLHIYPLCGILRESMCHDRVGWKSRCSIRVTREMSPLIHWTSSCSWWWARYWIAHGIILTFRVDCIRIKAKI